MVEEVKLQDAPNVDIDKQRKQLTIGFYIWNLNLYLITLLSFDYWLVVGITYILINTFIFKYMFGALRYSRTIFWHVLISILYFWKFNIFSWQILILGITTIINLGYWLVVEKRYKM